MILRVVYHTFDEKARLFRINLYLSAKLVLTLNTILTHKKTTSMKK